MKYPCNYCGACAIWLAAFEPGALETEEEVINACRKRKCALLGKEVIPEDVNEAYWLHRAHANDYIWVECSNCGFWIENYKAVKIGMSDTDFVGVKYHHCPCCGKKMKV